MSRVPVRLAPGEGNPLNVLGSPWTLKLAGEQTAGSLAVLESRFAPGEGAPPHKHEGHDETFYILDGTFRFRCDDEVVEAGPGAFFHVPRTHPHSFTCVGERPSTILAILSPAGFEKFFVEAATLSTERPDIAMFQTILAKYDQVLVEDSQV